MPKICLVNTFKTVQIEFPDDLPHPEGRRGGRGTSLHLARNRYRDVTVEELAHIEATRPDVFAALKVVRPSPIPKRTLRKLAAAAKPKAAPATAKPKRKKRSSAKK